MEILPGIHHFDTGPFNWYLLEAAGRLTLVDAGFPGHYRVFADGLRSLGRSPADLSAIILTHAHADHLGFAEHLRRLTRAPVFIHEDDRVAAGRPLQLPWFGLLANAWRPYTAGMLGHALRHGVFAQPGIRELKTFRDGDTLDVPGRPQVLHAPGHTPGEVAFFLADRRVLLSGDVLVTRNLLTGTAGAPQVPAPSLNTDDRQARRALERIRELGTVTLLPGHGQPWHGDMTVAVAGARTEN